jgi:hypothetical protein
MLRFFIGLRLALEPNLRFETTSMQHIAASFYHKGSLLGSNHF